jgi:hypothetical protein
MADEKHEAPPTSAKPRASGPKASPARPAAHVASSGADTKETSTVVLFPVHLEFLSVQVTFHRVPVADLKVRFTTLDGTEVEADPKTSELGIARAPRRVPAGSYVIELAHQPSMQVSTVPSPELSAPLVLPVRRPYEDLCERAEFGIGAPRQSNK